MKVTQEKLPASQIGLEIEITSEMSQKAYEQVIQKFTRSANIPGFRKGKVPRQVVIQRFGTTSLKAAALEELIDKVLEQAIAQEKIDAIGNYQLRSTFEELVNRFEPGAAMTFSASVDVQPEATLTQYQGFQLQAEEIKPAPDRLSKTLEQYQEQVATLIPVEDRVAQLKDTAVVDFKGVLPGDDPDEEPEAFAGGQADDFQVELDEGKFIPGFIEGIVGMAIGETKEIAIAFPESYPQEELAGLPVVFTVTLKELKAKELPELDDDFAQQVSDFETIAELRDSMETRFNEEATDKTDTNKEKAILDELVKHIEVEIPETLIERELSVMINQMAMQLQNQGIDVKRLFNQETVSMMKERSRPDAIDRIKRTLALGEVAKQESIQVEPAEIRAKVSEVLEEIGDDKDLNRDRLRDVIAEDLLKEKIVDWLIEHSTIELVPEGTLTPEEDDDDDALEALADESLTAASIGLTPESRESDFTGGAIDVVAEVVSESEPESVVLPESETEPESAVLPESDIPASASLPTKSTASTDDQ